MNSNNKSYILFTVFVSGLVVLGVEITAQRLIGNVFGSSNLVWANIIGLMLLYLAAGYFIGGRWADRSPYPTTFLGILAVGAFLTGLTPLVSQPVLRFAAEAMGQLNIALLGGSFVGVLLLFSVPMTLLGCASPFAIRLAIAEAKDAGRVSGQIYAVSTLGSLVGTFLPVLVMVPAVGTRNTILILAGLLLTVAVIGLLRHNWRAGLASLALPVALAVIVAVWPSGSIRPINFFYPEARVIPGSERESAYNLIQVAETADGTRWLFLNDSLVYHSIYKAGQLRTNGPFDFFLVAPYFNADQRPEDVRRFALVGLAAGTVAKQYTAVYGDSVAIDGIEIDPAVVDTGRRYFDMNEPNLTVIEQDGRWALQQLAPGYDVIGIDAYRPPYIPWQLTTREFFEEVRAKLDDDGALVVNVGRTPQDRRLVEAMAATVGSVFPSVYVVDLPRTEFNTMVYATAQPTSPSNLAANLRRLSSGAHPLLVEVLTDAEAGLQPTPTGGPVFTDDWAPVELIADTIVLNYFLGPE